MFILLIADKDCVLYDLLSLVMNTVADLGPFSTSLNRARISGFPLRQKCPSKGHVNDAATFQARCALLSFYLITKNCQDGPSWGLFT